jgi:hypothetical protein
MHRRLTRRLLTCLAVATLAVLAQAAMASAQADVGTFFDQRTEVNTVGTPECVSGDFDGTETLTFTTSGRFVATNTGFHVEGTEKLDIHTTFTNGYYIVGSASSHFTFETTQTSGETVFTMAGSEIHTIYNAEGEVVATVRFSGVSHITYRDANGNGQPDEGGEITASFDRFHFTCL